MQAMNCQTPDFLSDTSIREYLPNQVKNIVVFTCARLNVSIRTNTEALDNNSHRISLLSSLIQSSNSRMCVQIAELYLTLALIKSSVHCISLLVIGCVAICMRDFIKVQCFSLVYHLKSHLSAFSAFVWFSCSIWFCLHAHLKKIFR